jgi:toxin secretion/phage lysis holin
MFRARYVTEAAEAKTVVAVSSIFSHELVQALCDRFPGLCPFVFWVPDLIVILLGMMMLDMLTGVLAARGEGARITSRRLGEGVKRKVGMFAVIAASVLLEEVFSLHGTPLSGWLYRFVATWFIAVEFLSLYENAARLGVPMPRQLKTAMERLLQKAGQTMTDLLPPAMNDSQNTSPVLASVAPVAQAAKPAETP